MKSFVTYLCGDDIAKNEWTYKDWLNILVDRERWGGLNTRYANKKGWKMYSRVNLSTYLWSTNIVWKLGWIKMSRERLAIPVFLNETIPATRLNELLNLPWTHDAAVKTHRLLIKAPPQKWNWLFHALIDIWKGTSPKPAFLPPTILRVRSSGNLNALTNFPSH